MECDSDYMNIQETPYCYKPSQQKIIEEISKRVENLRSDGKLSPEVLSTIRK